MSVELIGDNYHVTVNNIGMYSDNTPMIKLGEDFDPTRIHTMVIRHTTTTAFVAAMFLVDSISKRGGKVKTLVLPYIPGARQDRINPTGDQLFAAYSFATMINDRSFSRVIVLDPHSPVAPSLIDRVVEYPLLDIAQRVWWGYTGIIAPDKGAKERAKVFSDVMGLPLCYGSKKRDVATGKLEGFEIAPLPFGHYLVVDDICDGGGTFMGLGEKIREQGNYADLYVTHGIFAKGVDGLKKIYKNIYTTDSLLQNHSAKVLVVPVVERMIDYV